MKTRFTLQHSLLAPGLLFLALSLSQCTKLVEVKKPANEILIADAFEDSTSATGAVTGIYGFMANHTGFEAGVVTLMTSKGADDIQSRGAADEFELNKLNSGLSTLSSMWSQPYSTLLTVNTALEGLNASTLLSSPLKNQLLGECYCSRAFINFHLVNLWGDAVALVLTANYVADGAVASSPSAGTYAQIVSDLTQAQALMTNTYPSANRARPNLQAANALLARVYLYMGKYSDAVTQASAVIGSGLYTLPAPASAFLQGSNETIWSLDMGLIPSLAGITPDGNTFVPLFSFFPPTYTLTSQLVAAFETGDQRKASWTNISTYAGAQYVYPYKYKKNYYNGAAAENYVLLRLAEQYLIRAEAYCRLGDFASSVADLNVVRARAGLTALPTPATTAACMAAIEQERRVELFAEWGHRWYDLKRWPANDGSSTTRADQVLSAVKTAWQPFQKLYPIYYQELIYDPNLVQNPGY